MRFCVGDPNSRHWEIHTRYMRDNYYCTYGNYIYFRTAPTAYSSRVPPPHINNIVLVVFVYDDALSRCCSQKNVHGRTPARPRFGLPEVDAGPRRRLGRALHEHPRKRRWLGGDAPSPLKARFQRKCTGTRGHHETLFTMDTCRIVRSLVRVLIIRVVPRTNDGLFSILLGLHIYLQMFFLSTAPVYIYQVC